MEVIKHGNTIKRAVCDKCGCDFLYVMHETYTCPNRATDKIDILVICPDCHKAVKVGEKE
jgi:RNase P subunit RPR2